MPNLNVPTETITLPSKGLVYPADSPLSSGEIEMRYMRSCDEDILTNINFIKQGTVIDKLLKSLVVSPVDIDDMITGDKNALLFAARILGYGKEYPIKFFNTSTKETDEYVIDLSTLSEKKIDESLFIKGKNEFSFTTPSGNILTFKFLTGKDEKNIETEIKGLQKLTPNGSFENTTRLKYIILSVDGKYDQAAIRKYVDEIMLAKDSRAFRKYYNEICPDIETTITVEKDGYVQEGVVFSIDINFFWPDAE